MIYYRGYIFRNITELQKYYYEKVCAPVGYEYEDRPDKIDNFSEWLDNCTDYKSAELLYITPTRRTELINEYHKYCWDSFVEYNDEIDWNVNMAYNTEDIE